MQDALTVFLAVFVGLFPIVNPLGMAPIFLRLTSGSTQDVRVTLARHIAAGSFALMAVSLGRRGAHVERLAAVAAGSMVAVLAVALISYLSYRFAGDVLRYLGETGTDVFMRLSAFILLRLGVQILTNGISDLPFLVNG
jgi:small neutral amino acid transporter SnatA (MarC family)